MERLIWAFIFIFTPAVILFFANKIKLLDKIGAIILSYGLGLLIGNLGWVPDEVEPVQRYIVMVTIPIAIPLLLFSMDLKRILRLTGRNLFAMFLGIVALVIVLVVGVYLFRDKFEDSELTKIAGMLVGLYTGGTPNLASLKTALGVSNEDYVLIHTSDTLICIIYMLIVMSVGKPLLSLFLPKFRFANGLTIKQLEEQKEFERKTREQLDDNSSAFVNLIKIENWRDLGIALLIVLVIVGLSLIVARLFPKNFFDAAVILAITSLAIAASFCRRVRNLKYTYQLGMYFILVFSFTVATLAEFDKLIAHSGTLVFFVAYTIWATFILHIILAAIFRVDVDTLLVVSTAMIMSPPFVPVTAQAIRNKFVIVPGLLVGLVGYAVGNYLGVFIAMILDKIF